MSLALTLGMLSYLLKRSLLQVNIIKKNFRVEICLNLVYFDEILVN